MPNETTKAIEWALTQTIVIPEMDINIKVKLETQGELVGKVREYFNEHNIDYPTYSYGDLVPYFPE